MPRKRKRAAPKTRCSPLTINKGTSLLRTRAREAPSAIDTIRTGRFYQIISKKLAPYAKSTLRQVLTIGWPASCKFSSVFWCGAVVFSSFDVRRAETPNKRKNLCQQFLMVDSKLAV
jgi:hypothetical protein